MKKLLTLTLALLMAASMTACGSKSETPAAPEAPAPAENVIATAADLAGKKVGVQAGTTGETYMTENVKDAKLGSYKSGMDAALDLKTGSIDAVMLDELPAKAIVAQNDDLMIVDPNLDPEEYAIAVKKGNTELLNSINATIKKIKSDGTYEKLVAAFMPAEGEIQVPPAIVTEGEKTVKMGTNAAFKPFEYVDGTAPIGFDISMAELIAQDMGAKLSVEDMNFDSLLSALDTGVIDFVAAGMTATDERKQSVDFSETYYSSKQVIIVKK